VKVFAHRGRTSRDGRQLVEAKRRSLVVVALGGQAVRLGVGIGHGAPVRSDGSHRRSYVSDAVAEHGSAHLGAGRARAGPQAHHRDNIVDLYAVLAVARAEAPAQYGSVESLAASQVRQAEGHIGDVAVVDAITGAGSRRSSQS